MKQSLLGYGGLLPFIFLALLIPLSLDYRLLFAIALVNYGAVILSFVGALNWGFAMTVRDMSAEQRRDQFIWSVIPALIAWIATFVANAIGLLAVGHRLCSPPQAGQAAVTGYELARLVPADAITAYPRGERLLAACRAR